MTIDHTPIDIEKIENYLTISMPESDQLILDDSRRITGPGMIWDKRGALIDVLVNGPDKQAVVSAGLHQIERVLAALGWKESETASRVFENGVTLVISAPADLLYSAVFAIETGWHLAAANILDIKPNNFDAMISNLNEVIALEQNPPLIALQLAANERGIDILSDDDFVSLGHGQGSAIWGVNDIPDPADIQWDQLYNLPVALITGTNGKSTSVRLTTVIGEAAGLVSGSTSTDFVKLGDEILDYGDYSGPGGARMLLRDKRLEIAFLECARGGILRRGLPLFQARAALVTNIAADHLGQYGVNTVEALAEAKFAVARAVADDGILVLNADDPLVVSNGLKFDNMKYWFALSFDNENIVSARSSGTACCWLDGEEICYFDGSEIVLRVDVNDIPVTMGGAARFNIQNVMGAIGLAKAMDMPHSAIIDGLTQFNATPDDNPGRCNEFDVEGARIFVDFAHNPHAIGAMSELLENLPAKRKYLLISHAGDRSDEEIQGLTKGALGFAPDTVVVAELADYLRGRELGEVPALIERQCRINGQDQIDQPEINIKHVASPSLGVEHILGQIEPGDIVLILALSERDKIFDLIKQAMN